mgnify:CR=1 FL=1
MLIALRFHIYLLGVILGINTWSKIMAGMINCMRFHPKEGQAEALLKAFSEYPRDYPFDDILHHIINLSDGE